MNRCMDCKSMNCTCKIWYPEKGADAPVLPSKNEIYAGIGIKVNPWPIEITIDKEWVKRLLIEFSKPLIITDEIYENGRWPVYIEEFLEKSEVWNGKNN